MFDVFIIADLVSLACHFLHVGLGVNHAFDGLVSQYVVIQCITADTFKNHRVCFPPEA